MFETRLCSFVVKEPRYIHLLKWEKDQINEIYKNS